MKRLRLHKIARHRIFLVGAFLPHEILISLNFVRDLNLIYDLFRFLVQLNHCPNRGYFFLKWIFFIVVPMYVMLGLIVIVYFVLRGHRVFIVQLSHFKNRHYILGARMFVCREKRAEPTHT